MFGEWLWCKHSVGYDALPDFFVVFDILDKATNKFVTYDQLGKLVDEKFTVVPLVKRFTVRPITSKKMSKFFYGHNFHRYFFDFIIVFPNLVIKVDFIVDFCYV